MAQNSGSGHHLHGGGDCPCKFAGKNTAPVQKPPAQTTSARSLKVPTVEVRKQ